MRWHHARWDGVFLPATVLSGVTEDAECVHDEIFGPADITGKAPVPDGAGATPPNGTWTTASTAR